MERGSAQPRSLRRMLVGPVLAGLVVSVAGPAMAGTFFSWGANTNAAVNDPFGLAPPDTNNGGGGSNLPTGQFLFGSETAAFDPASPVITQIGNASSSASAEAGDRFAKVSGVATVNQLTGNARGQGVAAWSATGIAGNDAVANLDVYFDRTLGYADVLSASDRLAQVQTLANLNYNSPDKVTALQYSVIGGVTMRVEEVGTGVYWENILVEGIIRNLDVQTLNGMTEVTGDLDDRAFGYSIFNTNISGQYVSTVTQRPFSLDVPTFGEVRSSQSTIFGISNLIFRSGMSYNVSLSSGCTASIYAQADLVSAPEVDASCDASNSAYWLGLRNVRNFDGAPRTITLTSNDTGLDLAGPSPFAPDVAPVPEPATWALMIGGFGLAGAALRRRRVGSAELVAA